MLKLIRPSKEPSKESGRLSRRPPSNLRFEEIFTLENDKTFAKKGRLISITLKGFVLHFKKKDLTVKESVLEQLINRPAGFVISDFETELHGVIKGFHPAGRDIWRADIGYLEQTPYFYKQSVVDLLC